MGVGIPIRSASLRFLRLHYVSYLEAMILIKSVETLPAIEESDTVCREKKSVSQIDIRDQLFSVLFKNDEYTFLRLFCHLFLNIVIRERQFSI